MGLGFVWFLHSPLSPKAFPAAIGTTFKGNKCHSQHDGQEEANDIQGVVLVPGEVVRRRAQVRGPLVPHHELHPEHSQVQRLNGAVLVESGEAHDVLLVARQRDSCVGAQDIQDNELSTLYACSLGGHYPTF